MGPSLEEAAPSQMTAPPATVNGAAIAVVESQRAGGPGSAARAQGVSVLRLRAARPALERIEAELPAEQIAATRDAATNATLADVTEDHLRAVGM